LIALAIILPMHIMKVSKKNAAGKKMSVNMRAAKSSGIGSTKQHQILYRIGGKTKSMNFLPGPRA